MFARWCQENFFSYMMQHYDPSNNALVNLVPLCHSCHSHKTMRDMGHNVRMGCDVTGQPLDHWHHWHHWNNAVRADLAHPVGAEKSPATEQSRPTVLPSFNANPKA
jgi:hypothetical protein